MGRITMKKRTKLQLVVAVALIAAVVVLLVTNSIPWEVGIGLLGLIAVAWGAIRRQDLSKLLGR